MKPLVDRDDPVLRLRAGAVDDIGSKKIASIITRMKKALYAEEDGVAIAAPQVGASLRIFIVKGSDPTEEGSLKQDRVFINPEILKVSKKKEKREEGCLSLRYLYGTVLRHEKITIRAYDESGKRITVGATGLLAQIFQHEMDHLEGVLFTDKAENVRDVPPEKDL
ncbi:MAG TPA: peptide deformylase [Candidatus Paceibacterota bacterium]